MQTIPVERTTWGLVPRLIAILLCLELFACESGGGGAGSSVVAPEPSVTLSLIAGDIGGPGSLDGVGEAARFSGPTAITIDSTGNLYVSDTNNHTIRKITPSGVVTTIAGTPGAIGSADGIGAAARFHSPRGITIDAAGNLYVADSYNYSIRKITPAGAVTTLAGMTGVLGTADGTGSAAQFAYPNGISIDAAGNLYIADSDGFTNLIRKVTAAGVVTTLAGSPSNAGSADGTGTAARFQKVDGITTDPAGNLYVVDGGNSTIRKITAAGVVTTIAGTAGVKGSADGTGAAAQFYFPRGIVRDPAGNLYVDDDNNTVRKITPTGAVTTLAGVAGLSGSVDGAGVAARFNNPYGIALDAAGNLYVVESANNTFVENSSNTIRRITPDGVVTTLAGAARVRGSTDGTGAAAKFSNLRGITSDAGGNLYVVDAGNSTIRKITPAGVVTTLAGAADGVGAAAQFQEPNGIAIDPAGNLYVCDSGNYTIRKITPSGVVTTLAGAAGISGATDGMGSAARFYRPQSIAADTAGNLYVTDTNSFPFPKGNIIRNNLIRKITPAGVVSTLAGDVEAGSMDGTGQAARFRYPLGITSDAAGNLYVVDAGNGTIRKITPAGVVTTLAGTAGESGYADGTGATVRFSSPSGIASDAIGNLYVIDTGNNAIRKVTSAGAVTTVAGIAGELGIKLGIAPGIGTPYGITSIGPNAFAITSRQSVLKLLAE